MFCFRLCVVSMLAIVVTGCAHDCYVVEMTPHGGRFERQLTCWHVQPGSEDGKTADEIQPLSKEQLARLGKLYERRETPGDAKKHVFAGSFSGRTPGDVGGAGSYTHFRSTMGTLSIYVERSRGQDDPESMLAKRRAAADQLVDLVVGWFESEMGSEPNFDGLRRFLDEDLRRDIKNLGIYVWAGDVATRYKAKPDAEFWIRAGQYLIERDYFRPAELPQFARFALTQDDAFLLARVQRIAARKLGLPEGERRPPSLAFLDDLEQVQDSWDRYVRTTEYFQNRLRRHKAEHADDESPPAPPTPNDVSRELIAEAVLYFDFSLAADSLEVKLHCSSRPFDTNGKWDAEKRIVRWSGKLTKNPSLPTLCSAIWSDPDREFQTKHFGKTVLTDGDLAQYVLWYGGLHDDEQGEWDSFLSKLTPGKPLIPAIKSFRFSADPPPDPGDPDKKPPGLADPVRPLLLKGL